MEQPRCTICEGDLSSWDIRYNKKTCQHCLNRKRTAFLLDDQYIDHTFATIWAKGFFKRLGSFLQEQEVPLESQARILSKAATIFQEAEKTFHRPGEISEEWLEEMIKKAGAHLLPTFFRAFLLKEHIIVAPDQDEKKIKAILAKIESIPQGYRRLVEVYFNERTSLRERQIKQQAKRTLTMNTFRTDFTGISTLIQWLTEHIPDLTGWEMVQEEHINTFLLTLAPKGREVMRKRLYLFFSLARRRRVITHVPMMNLPTRELPQTAEPLTRQEQKALAQLIHNSMYTHPEEALLAALCFYHSLSTSQICRIRVSNVDIEQGCIRIEERPPVFLLAEDFHLLEQFLLKRKELPYTKKRSYLFISNQHVIKDKPVSEFYVTRKVGFFTGYTPRRLRITCFAALSAIYGPQYLVEAFGLSLSQAARYGKMEEFLLEEEVKQQREEFLELSRQLEQYEKQYAACLQSKMEQEKHGNTSEEQ